MLAPEINWYFDGTVQEQVKDDDTGVTAVAAAQLIYAKLRRHQEETSRGENCLLVL
jgi:hypothetical protein